MSSCLFSSLEIGFDCKEFVRLANASASAMSRVSRALWMVLPKVRDARVCFCACFKQDLSGLCRTTFEGA